jgi:hypothetical protein
MAQLRSRYSLLRFLVRLKRTSLFQYLANRSFTRLVKAQRLQPSFNGSGCTAPWKVCDRVQRADYPEETCALTDI